MQAIRPPVSAPDTAQQQAAAEAAQAGEWLKEDVPAGKVSAAAQGTPGLDDPASCHLQGTVDACCEYIIHMIGCISCVGPCMAISAIRTSFVTPLIRAFPLLDLCWWSPGCMRAAAVCAPLPACASIFPAASPYSGSRGILMNETG